MSIVLKREEIDFIFDLYEPEQKDESNKDTLPPETEKLDTAQTKPSFDSRYLT